MGHGIKRQDSHPLSPTVQPDLPGDPVPPGVPSGLRLREAHSRPGPQSWGGGGRCGVTSRPRDRPDAPLRTEGPPHAGLRERAEGTGAADTRDSSPRPPAQRGRRYLRRPAKSERPPLQPAASDGCSLVARTEQHPLSSRQLPRRERAAAGANRSAGTAGGGTGSVAPPRPRADAWSFAVIRL